MHALLPAMVILAAAFGLEPQYVLFLSMQDADGVWVHELHLEPVGKSQCDAMARGSEAEARRDGHELHASCVSIAGPDGLGSVGKGLAI